MKVRKTSWRRQTEITISTLTMTLLGVAFFFWVSEISVAQNSATASVISGSVTTDRGVVRAFRVRAADTVHKITYTVFTNKGRYQIFNLPASRYDIQVIEEGYDSPVEHVEVKAGESKTANLELKAKVAADGAEIGRASCRERV